MPPSSQPAPETLGPFRLIRVLGEGATGTVYLAEHREFPQQVAIKLFHPDLVLDGLAGPYGEEQRLLRELDHPHIVKSLQWIESFGRRALVMEYVPGVSIEEFADAHRLSLRSRAELLNQVLDAVEYAHRHLIVHRDLKPANILVTADAQAKLLDFGSAGELAPATLTPEFSSPEQRDPHAGAVTVASDVYSAGLIARLLLAGVPPAADVETAPSRLISQAKAEARSAGAKARALAADTWIEALRGDLDAILLRALRPRAEDRYASAAQLGGDLRAWSAGETVLARPVGRLATGWRWMRRHRVLTAVAAMLLAVVLLSTGGVLWQAGRAVAQRRRAETRLHDLVRMTGALDGELYASVRALPGSEEARTVLLKSATDSLDALAASDQESSLALELAGQYARLARLERDRPPGDGAANAQAATRDVGQGLRLLAQFRYTGQSREQADIIRKQLLEVRASLGAAP